jgi:hypothetical protein
LALGTLKRISSAFYYLDNLEYLFKDKTASDEAVFSLMLDTFPLFCYEWQECHKASSFNCFGNFSLVLRASSSFFLWFDFA